MKRVEFWRWTIFNLQGTKKVQSNYRMTEADALARHPEAVRVPGTCEVRELPETEEELRAFHQRPAARAPNSL